MVLGRFACEVMVPKAELVGVRFGAENIAAGRHCKENYLYL